MKLLLQLRSKKQNFLEEAIKNRQPENEDFFFSQHFFPCQQHTSQYEITFQKSHPTSFLTSLFILQLLQYSSTAHFLVVAFNLLCFS